MIEVLEGDAIEQLRELPSESVQCCVTSPPYWGLRDYGIDSQLGLEKTPEEYVRKMVEIFREVRRVLRKDGTLWLNLGDSYASIGHKKSNSGYGTTGLAGGIAQEHSILRHENNGDGLKHKDLCGIPWRVAFALQADGWWLRSDIIWAKPNPMPESVTDRPTKSHEYLFLLTKSANYFYDAEAIKEKACRPDDVGYFGGAKGRAHVTPEGDPNYRNGHEQWGRQHTNDANRNKRSVWTVATAPYPEAHFATYPPDLIKPCIMAGTSAKGCCAKCGAPWERVVERESFCDVPRGSNPSSFRALGDPQQAGVSCKTQTLGWQPTCKCDELLRRYTPEDIYLPNGVLPCTVLDPFAGSGATGAVALELGRKAILIELNPKYVALIEERCDVTLGLALA